MTANMERLRGWKVVWVSRDSVEVTRKYCEQNQISPSDVLADPTYGTFVQLGLEKVPHMVVIRPDGVVEKVWRGRLDGAVVKDISAYLRAPGERLTHAPQL